MMTFHVHVCAKCSTKTKCRKLECELDTSKGTWFGLSYGAPNECVRCALPLVVPVEGLSADTIARAGFVPDPPGVRVRVSYILDGDRRVRKVEP